MPRASFLLSKWYLDVVTDAGAVAILYAARLRWGRLHACYASALIDAPGAPLSEDVAIRGIARPRLAGDDLSWANARLAVHGTWRRMAPPIRQNLLRTASGALQWACHMPLAQATVRCGDRVLSGYGYAETLRLSLPPWRLPFDTVRWGHHASGRRSLVWIACDGRERRQWVWLDGQLQPAAEVADEGILNLPRGERHRVESGRVVRDRRVLAALRGALPSLARRVAGPLARMHETKRLGRSAVGAADGRTDHGWTLHEVVRW
ncbi:MAG TPA: hypothetical protein VEH83_09855 [Gemmatimonadales bacterium]|nr:hypothetical protein [Gemmatimonadales bacterium]